MSYYGTPKYTYSLLHKHTQARQINVSKIHTHTHTNKSSGPFIEQHLFKHVPIVHRRCQLSDLCPWLKTNHFPLSLKSHFPWKCIHTFLTRAQRQLPNHQHLQITIRKKKTSTHSVLLSFAGSFYQFGQWCRSATRLTNLCVCVRVTLLPMVRYRLLFPPLNGQMGQPKALTSTRHGTTWHVTRLMLRKTEDTGCSVRT